MDYRIPQAILIAVAAFALGWSFHTGVNSRDSYQIREDSNKYEYINPLIFVDNSEVVYKELNSLKDKVEEYINAEVEAGELERVGFYYRDLNSGKWTGVNADEKFEPGSILKVATLSVYLKLAEDDPQLLQRKFFYKKDPSDRQNYPPEKELEEGMYTAEDLLVHAIIDSDNAAALALSLPKLSELRDYYKTLRLTLPEVKVNNFMSPRDVSRIFRTLYNSTYLLDNNSEQALALLARTKFSSGLNQGVPSGTKLAHKFGEHTVYFVDGRSPEFQLHDCGIVYKNSSPYFVCVMTQGRNLKNQEKVIGEISKLSYNFKN